MIYLIDPSRKQSWASVGRWKPGKRKKLNKQTTINNDLKVMLEYI